MPWPSFSYQIEVQRSLESSPGETFHRTQAQVGRRAKMLFVRDRHPRESPQLQWVAAMAQNCLLQDTHEIKALKELGGWSKTSLVLKLSSPSSLAYYFLSIKINEVKLVCWTKYQRFQLYPVTLGGKEIQAEDGETLAVKLLFLS